MSDLGGGGGGGWAGCPADEFGLNLRNGFGAGMLSVPLWEKSIWLGCAGVTGLGKTAARRVLRRHLCQWPGVYWWDRKPVLSRS